MFADFNNNQNADDFLDEFRQKLNTEAVETFEERKNEINRSKNVFIGTVSGIALAAVVGWFVLSPRYTDNLNTELPIIRRPQTAVKVQPANPGGMEILNQDKSVYDIIEKKDTSDLKVEKLLPAPEEPQLPTIVATDELNDTIAEQAKKIIETAEAEKIITAEPQVQNIEIKETPEPKTISEETIADTPKTTKEVSSAPLPEPKVEVITEQPQPAPKTVTQPPQETPKVVVATGPWQVQLLSSPNRKAIDTAWSGLIKKYPMLDGQPREIETADLGAKGTFYRLKAGGFAERSGADRLCNDIKALGGTCIVKKK